MTALGAATGPLVVALAESPLQAAAVEALLHGLVGNLVRTAVLAALAVLIGGSVGLFYRWYADQRVPDGLAILVGVSAVAIYLNTAGALGDVIGGQNDMLTIEAAVFNVVTFLVAAVSAVGGGRAGDRLGTNVFAVAGSGAVDQELSRLVKSVGRVTTVEVPDDIDDIEGYDQVGPETKEALAGQRLVFPHRLTLGELREQFVERLRTDYGIGHVDVEFAADGTVEYLAVGSREAGIGPTLAPSSAAVAVKADPANAASPGDAVQVWTAGDPAADEPPRRVASAELRGAAEDVVTLAMDEEEALAFDTEARYRLVTLPVEARVDREFAAQLRTSEETMGVVTIAEDSPLAGGTVGALDVAVVAVRRPDGDIEAIPPRRRTLSAGETVYVIARPDRLRRLEAAAGDEGTVGQGADAPRGE